MKELRDTIQAFERNQLKHFISIASSKGTYALKDEALDSLELPRIYLTFNTFSQNYFKSILTQLSENNYKQVKDCLGILLKENSNYLDAVINGLRELINEDPQDHQILLELFRKIDVTCSILFSELLEIGFSKSFLYRFIRAIFVNRFQQGEDFNIKFGEFTQRLTETDNQYQIVFKVDTTENVKKAIKSIDPAMEIKNDLEDLGRFPPTSEYDNFAQAGTERCFLNCIIPAPDYFAALKSAQAILAENFDILNLGFSDEFLSVHSRVLIIDLSAPQDAQFQESKNFLDGKYTVAKEHYQSFIDKLPPIIANNDVQQETKDKIKSAIRYLRLGNQSTEVEHKFINYWIGLEYLFSNYESNNTINRIKDYFVACHSVSYVKRNGFDFHRSLQGLKPEEKAALICFDEDPVICLINVDIYINAWNILLDSHPLIAYRAKTLGDALCQPDGKIKKEYIEKHKKNLIIHFTRIYRLRNEIIHDAATNTNNESIASNLRYYLTFILNGVIDYLSNSEKENNSIEDYFTINEIYLGNISQNGSKFKDYLNVPASISFIS